MEEIEDRAGTGRRNPLNICTGFDFDLKQAGTDDNDRHCEIQCVVATLIKQKLSLASS